MPPPQSWWILLWRYVLLLLLGVVFERYWHYILPNIYIQHVCHVHNLKANSVILLFNHYENCVLSNRINSTSNCQKDWTVNKYNPYSSVKHLHVYLSLIFPCHTLQCTCISNVFIHIPFITPTYSFVCAHHCYICSPSLHVQLLQVWQDSLDKVVKHISPSKPSSSPNSATLW